ncbi:DUF6346 domain-containing protein [Actinoplanes sp. NPDC051411]|uniref:DUF6346 domain-containing protein n=1 Tax=Actinoplanes sp. NPDC051411 TaxID=3155522 RepID=UPI003429942D
MDELLAEAETNVRRTRADRNAPQDPATSGDGRRGTWWGSLLGVLILLAISAVLLGTAETVARFSRPDYNDARDHGTATVEQCQRRGPITIKGFGYYNRCTVKVTWDGGLKSRIDLDKPGFLPGAKPGDTFKIGENQGSRGSVGYSRPDLPSRGWVAWMAGLIALVGILPLFAVIYYLKSVVKNIVKRR